jgi:hypothetical protein
MTTTRSAIERMAAQSVPTDEQLRRATPVLEYELNRLTAQPRITALPDPTIAPLTPSPVLRRWGPALVAAVVVGVLVAVQAILLPVIGEQQSTASTAAAPPAAQRPQTGGAVPPPTPAGPATADPAEFLRQLADRVARRPVPEAGPVDYTRSISRSHSIGEDGSTGQVVDQVEEMSQELWISSDGSGRVVRDVNAPPGAQSPSEDVDETYPSGLGPRRLDLPADRTELVEALITAADGDAIDFSAAADLIDIIGGVRDAQIIDPPTLATLLRMLAETDGLSIDPAVTDLAGREGVAIRSVPLGQENDLTIQMTLIVDPTTGELLGFDKTIVQGGPLPDRVPLELSRLAWLESGRVDTVGERP